MIDSNDDHEMDFDDQRDYMDQDIHHLDSLHSFFNDMPDWMNMTPEDINVAVKSLRVPNPSEGHILLGISLQEAIEVSEWHFIHERHY